MCEATALPPGTGRCTFNKCTSTPSLHQPSRFRTWSIVRLDDSDPSTGTRNFNIPILLCSLADRESGLGLSACEIDDALLFRRTSGEPLADDDNEERPGDRCDPVQEVRALVDPMDEHGIGDHHLS